MPSAGGITAPMFVFAGDADPYVGERS